MAQSVKCLNSEPRGPEFIPNTVVKGQAWPHGPVTSGLGGWRYKNCCRLLDAGVAERIMISRFSERPHLKGIRLGVTEED